jgi:hypothetical protein
MPFDLATAKPVGGGFDLATAKPVMGPKDIPDQGTHTVAPEDAGPGAKVEALLEGGANAITGAVGFAGGALGGIAGQVAAGKLGSPEGASEAIRAGQEGAQKMQFFGPAKQSASEYLDMVSKAIEISKVQGLNPTQALTMASAPVKGAGGVKGALAPEAEALKRVGGKLADVVTPMPSKEIEALAAKAEGMGIELRPDMLSNNRIAKMIGEALEQVPMSGSKAEQRQMAFNQALVKIIGGDAKAQRLTPDVFDQAMTKAGETIGTISKETPVTVDSDLRAAFNQHVLEASKFQTQDVAKVVSNYVQELDAAAGPGGVIPGETFKRLNSKIGQQIRNATNGDLKYALGQLQETMHDALEKNIKSPERLAELQDARYRYAMGKMIEPLVATAKGGDISPAGLMGAVTGTKDKKTKMARGKGGDIGELARIGQAFLKEPPSSGTGERLGAYAILRGILGGGAGGFAVAEPMSAAGVIGTTLGTANLYNRLGPALTKRAIRRRSIDPAENQPWSGVGPVNRLSE